MCSDHRGRGGNGAEEDVYGCFDVFFQSSSISADYRTVAVNLPAFRII